MVAVKLLVAGHVRMDAQVLVQVHAKAVAKAHALIRAVAAVVVAKVTIKLIKTIGINIECLNISDR